MEKKDNNSNFYENGSSDEKINRLDDIKDTLHSIFDIVNTIFSPLKALIKIHYKLAVKELKRDSSRLFVGLFSLFLALFFFIIVWILFNVLSIIALYEFLNLKIFYAILIITGINLIISLILFLKGLHNLKKPFLSETQKIVKETLKDLK